MRKQTYKALRKIAYGGDLGDGSYRDRIWSMVYSPDWFDTTSARNKKIALSSLRNTAQFLKEAKKFTVTPEGSNKEVPVTGVYVTKDKYGGDAQNWLSADEWLAKYNAVKNKLTDEAIEDLTGYQFMRYDYDYDNKSKHRGSKQTNNGEALLMLLAGLGILGGGAAAMVGIPKLMNKLLK